MELYVKKVCSWNPTEYEYIGLWEAQSKYQNYIVAYIKYSYGRGISDIKTFEQWLETEI